MPFFFTKSKTWSFIVAILGLCFSEEYTLVLQQHCLFSCFKLTVDTVFLVFSLLLLLLLLHLAMSQTNKCGGMKQLWMFVFVGLVTVKWVEGFENATLEEVQYVTGRGFYRPLMVGLTLINGAAAKGAGMCVRASLHEVINSVLLHSV